MSSNFFGMSDLIITLLPLFLILGAISIGVLIFALVDVAKRTEDELTLPKVAWVIIIIIFNSLCLGSIAYFIAGKRKSDRF